MATPPEARSPGQLARHLFELIFDRRDVDALRPFWTESSVNRFLALGVDARGPDQTATFFRELLAAFPDLQMTIENVVEDDAYAVVQWSLGGTFDGASFQGIEPTGGRELAGTSVEAGSLPMLVDVGWRHGEDSSPVVMTRGTDFRPWADRDARPSTTCG
jgi:hypothetical protein